MDGTALFITSIIIQIVTILVYLFIDSGRHLSSKTTKRVSILTALHLAVSFLSIFFLEPMSIWIYFTMVYVFSINLITIYAIIVSVELDYGANIGVGLLSILILSIYLGYHAYSSYKSRYEGTGYAGGRDVSKSQKKVINDALRSIGMSHLIKE